MKRRTTTVDDIALSAVLATLLLTCALSVWAATPQGTPAVLAPVHECIRIAIQPTKEKS